MVIMRSCKLSHGESITLFVLGDSVKHRTNWIKEKWKNKLGGCEQELDVVADSLRPFPRLLVTAGVKRPSPLKE